MPTLFKALGEETGIRTIIESLIDLAIDDDFQISNINWQDDMSVCKYALFIISLVDERWKWFRKELTDDRKMMLVQPDSFDRFKILVATACGQNDISQHVTNDFINLLESKKEYLIEKAPDLGSAH